MGLETLIVFTFLLSFVKLPFFHFRQPNEAQLPYISNTNVCFGIRVRKVIKRTTAGTGFSVAFLLMFLSSSPPFRFLYFGETFSTLQLAGAIITIGAIYMVNYKEIKE